MKRNFTMALVAALSVFTLTSLTTGAAFAQDPAKKPKRGATATSRRTNPLTTLPAALRAADLTPEQQEKVRELSAKMVDDIKASLTPDQLKTFEEAMKGGASAAGRNAKGADGTTPKRGASSRANGGALMTQLKTDLTLTSEQEGKILPLVQDAQKEIAAKTKDARANGADPKATRQDVMGLMNALKDKIRPMLTAEQQTKLDTIELGKRKKK